MQTQSNEQLCALAQKGDAASCGLLVERNLGFIRKTALELYRTNSLEQSDLSIDLDDLTQEGCIGLLNAIPLFDDQKGIKFLTYAAPAIRNAMTDLCRKEAAQFEQRMTDEQGDLHYKQVYLDDILPGDERLLRIESIVNPFARNPEEVLIKKETLLALYAALGQLTNREQTYLLYRYGFTDDMEHPLSNTAIHFRLSESRARRTEKTALTHLRKKFL